LIIALIVNARIATMFFTGSALNILKPSR